MIICDTEIRVRYGETDKMGFLYHARYLDYYDVARSETIRRLGTTNLALENDGFRLPVISAKVDYGQPARYDELLTVRCIVREMPGVRMRFDYEVYRENGERINTGHTVLAFMSAATSKACRPPQWFLDILKVHF